MQASTIFTAFILFPVLALAIGSIFLRLYLKKKTRFSLSSALLWFLYFIYETLIQMRILCTVECNIRIDLLIIYPVLLALSLLAVYFYYRKQKQ